MPNNDRKQQLAAFGRLLDILDTLRERCPWDSVQTNASLRPNTIEETMELAEAIIADDNEKIAKELGDVLLHVVFYAKIGSEKGAFDIADVCNLICDKLVYRHPHIYGNVKATDASQVRENWEVLKLHEKGGNKTLLAGVPVSLPSLVKAERVQEKAAGVGFDWAKPEDVWDKVHEELGEVEEALRSGDADNREEEIGDLLFSIVNAARLYGVRADNALARTNRKFITRFNHIEEAAHRMGVPLNDLTLEQMDALWNEAKAIERGEKQPDNPQ